MLDISYCKKLYFYSVESMLATTMWSKLCQIGGYSNLLCLELPLHGNLSERFVVVNQKCSCNTDFVIANTPTGDYVEMKKSIEDAFYHLTTGQESRRAATVCYAAQEEEDRLSTLETVPVPGKKKPVYSTIPLPGEATRRTYQGSLASEIP